MFGLKTRDIIIETATIVRGIEKTFDKHSLDNEKKFKDVRVLIEECSKSCAAEERFDKYVTDTGTSLTRIEKKVDAAGIAKKTRREILTEIAKIVTIAALIIGSFIAYLDYRDKNKKGESVKIETMLQEILKKG